MSIAISDNFNNIRQLTGYDEAGTTVPAVDANLATVLANVVQNLRVFSHEINRNRVQSDLDGHTMLDPLPLLPAGMEGDTNTDIELFPRVPDEAWTTTGNSIASNSTGLSADITYDKQTAYKNWKGGVMTLAGGAAVIYAESIMADFPIDISGLTKISLVADLHGTGTITNLLIRLRDANANDSGEVALTNDTGKRWATNLSGFGPVDLTQVTTVIIHAQTDVSPTAGDKLYLFAVRGHNTAFDPSIGFGLNTIQGALTVPVTFDLASPVYPLPDVVRGTGTASDPTPEDGETRLLIDAGALSATTGGNYHRVDLVLRQKMGEDTLTRVEFYWNDTDAHWKLVSRVTGADTTLSGPTTVDSGVYDAIIGSIDASGIFWLDARLKDTGILISLFESDANEELLTQHYLLGSAGAPSVHTELVRFRGRVGYRFLPFDGDRDVLLYNFIGVVLGLSTLRTKVFNSVTPVEAVQLFGSFAPDANLFTDFESGLAMDSIRSLSGNPTWKGSSGTSNTFVVPDFTQSYVDFDIWVPQDANASGDPLNVQLLGEGGPSDIVLPVQELQPGIWNRVEIDLSPYSGLGIDGGSYALQVGNGSFADLTWVFNLDYVTVGHRRVAWSASCDGGNNFYYFRDCVNDEDAALHFPRVDVNGNPGRGTQLVIQAEALTDDAWLSSFNVKVKYAELGKPTYY